MGEAGFDRLFGLVGADELVEDVGEFVGHAGGLVDADGLWRRRRDKGSANCGDVADAGLGRVV